MGGGGKTCELLCNKPPCNVLNGAITSQYRSVVYFNACMNSAVCVSCVTLCFMLPVLILRGLLPSDSLALPPSRFADSPFDLYASSRFLSW